MEEEEEEEDSVRTNALDWKLLFCLALWAGEG